MCKGGGSSSSTIDPRILSMLQGNYSNAQNVASRPYQPYAGQLTADLTPSQNEAGSLLQGAQNIGQSALDTGVNAASAGTRYRAPQVQGGSYSPALAQPGQTAGAASIDISGLPLLSLPAGLSDLSSYTNPYTQDVADQTMKELGIQNEQQLMNNAEAATSDNAFGGTRQAVADALTNKAFQQTAANTLAGLNSQGFNAASGLLQNNQQMGLQAGGQNLNALLSAYGQNAGLQQGANLFNAGNQQQTNLANAGVTNAASQFGLAQQLDAALANQGAAGQAQGLNDQAAGLLGNLGSAQNADYLSGVNALNGFGTEQQTTLQNALNAAYQQYLNQFNYPVQMQELLNSVLSGGLGANTSNPAAAGTSVGGLLGGVGSLGSAAAALLPLL